VKKAMVLPLATVVSAGGFSLWAQVDDAAPFPKAFRKWAHVKSVLVGPQSAAFATEGGIHYIYASEKAIEGYETGKFPDGSVIVYHLLETKEIDGNTIEGPTCRIDVMVKQSELYRTTGGWKFMSFLGDNRTDGKLTAARQAVCADCHAKRKKTMISFSGNSASETDLLGMRELVGSSFTAPAGRMLH
jgi:hypothetical protein